MHQIAGLVPAVSCPENMIASGTDPAKSMDLTVLTDLINEFLANLPKQARNLFVCRYYYMDSLKDAAAYSGMSQSAAKSALFRMRNDLREYLVREGYENGRKLSSYLSGPGMNVYHQQNGDVGYGIECECPWEPEHKCLILIRNDECVYVGPSDMLDPWDEEYLHCVWDG